jgi:hypothetical protein
MGQEEDQENIAESTLGKEISFKIRVRSQADVV